MILQEWRDGDTHSLEAARRVCPVAHRLFTWNTQASFITEQQNKSFPFSLCRFSNILHWITYKTGHVNAGFFTFSFSIYLLWSIHRDVGNCCCASKNNFSIGYLKVNLQKHFNKLSIHLVGKSFSSLCSFTRTRTVRSGKQSIHNLSTDYVLMKTFWLEEITNLNIKRKLIFDKTKFYKCVHVPRVPFI